MEPSKTPPDQAAARTRSKGAERVARHRERQALAGLVSTSAPADLVAQVKAAGGWAAWLEAQALAQAVAPVRPVSLPPAPPVAPAQSSVLPADIEAQMREVGFEQWLDLYVDAYLARLSHPEPSAKDQQHPELAGRIAHLPGWRRRLAALFIGGAR